MVTHNCDVLYKCSLIGGLERLKTAHFEGQVMNDCVLQDLRPVWRPKTAHFMDKTAHLYSLIGSPRRLKTAHFEGQVMNDCVLQDLRPVWRPKTAHFMDKTAHLYSLIGSPRRLKTAHFEGQVMDHYCGVLYKFYSLFDGLKRLISGTRRPIVIQPDWQPKTA